MPNGLEIATHAGRRGRFVGYATAIHRYKPLERNQEQQLARRWQEQRDRHATDALITSHLRLAAKVARGYRGYGLPLTDIVAEANLGLVIAASRFEPDRGSRFSTYALWWIKATIHGYILRSWSLVKIGTTAAQRRLFFRLRREMQKVTSEPAIHLDHIPRRDFQGLSDGRCYLWSESGCPARELLNFASQPKEQLSLCGCRSDFNQRPGAEDIVVNRRLDPPSSLKQLEALDGRGVAVEVSPWRTVCGTLQRAGHGSRTAVSHL